jgi:hypothetical protein
MPDGGMFPWDYRLNEDRTSQQTEHTTPAGSCPRGVPRAVVNSALAIIQGVVQPGTG